MTPIAVKYAPARRGLDGIVGIVMSYREMEKYAIARRGIDIREITRWQWYDGNGRRRRNVKWRPVATNENRDNRRENLIVKGIKAFCSCGITKLKARNAE